MLNPYVRTFIKVAENGSFSKASEHLYISKVSVMNQINALETYIGVSLFRRTHHGVILTDAGKVLYKNAVKLLYMSENTIKEARQIGGAVSRTIRIGTSMMRPCNELVELWENINHNSHEYQFSIVPFSDDTYGLDNMLNSLGDKIDCFVSPCASMSILMNYSFLPFSTCNVAVAMSKKHPLAKKEILKWEDLEHESLLLIKRGEAYVLDEMRDDILGNHPNISIVDFNGFYDISTFNMCEQKGYLMETLDIWTDLHPSLATVPIKWKYKMPYGIIYSNNPSKTVKEFVDIIAKTITSYTHK